MLDTAGREASGRRTAPHTPPLAHRAFVRWALVLTLVFGAGWGAHLLFEIGLAKRFDAVSASAVVAHGMAQLWGFTTLFIVGIALRYLPITTGCRPAPRTTRRVILAAIVIGVAANYLWSVRPSDLEWLGPLSGASTTLAALLAAALLARPLRHRFGPFPLAVAIAGAWLLAWAGLSLGLSLRDPAAGPGAFTAEERLLLMELPLLGLALGSVHAFGARLLPGFLSTRAAARGPLAVAMVLHHLGLGVLLGGRVGDRPIWIASGSVLVLAGAVAFLVALHGLRARPRAPRPKVGVRVPTLTIRVALLWLPVSLGAMALLSVVEAIGGTSLPHAYHGAARHAFTVGFLVTFMLGVAQRLLPILGRRASSPRMAARSILILLSIGNLLRVTMQVVAEHETFAFSLLPLSSVLELTAIVLFTIGAWRATNEPDLADPTSDSTAHRGRRLPGQHGEADLRVATHLVPQALRSPITEPR